ncbi:MAG: cobyrinate a,c-diamide synthase [Desulfobacteraceae bacterium]|nr:cobyrinate a,c-diamide synthase [Desulfobacteraceae bacterium]
MKAFLIAGTHSGSGKTIVTMGVMAALVNMGLKVQPFKCGPDFIDPTLHRLITGRTSRNLDLWMCGDAFVAYTFSTHAAKADVAVVEGVMGLFDGGTSSSASLAKSLGLPVILVIDVRSCAETVAAVVKGFEAFDPGLVQGVIFNRVGSRRHLELLKDSVTRHCATQIVGYLPRDIDFEMPSRHLGLFMGDEAPIDKNAIKKLKNTVSECIDIKKLLCLEAAPRQLETAKPEGVKALSRQKMGLGVARDEAFCFYYEDNLDIFRKMGAEIIEFSPLHDASLPDGLNAIYLGGGYPELYAEKLSLNHGMLSSIKDWSSRGGFIYAECGGFMYLTEGIETTDKKFYPMAGVYPVRASMKGRLSALGYKEIYLAGETFFGRTGTVLKGHEFHYSVIGEMPSSVKRVFKLADGGREGHLIKNTLGTYVHIHFGETPWAVRNFTKSCVEAACGD